MSLDFSWGTPNNAAMYMEVPESQYAAITAFIGYSDDQMSALLAALEKAKPTLKIPDLAFEVAREIEADLSETLDVLKMLGSLYSSFAGQSKPADEFVDEVCKTIEAAGKDKLVPANREWTSFRNALKEALSFHSSLGVTSKALSVMRQSKRVYCTSRIVTDIRPIFDLDPSKRPAGACIVHSLKIAFHEDGKRRTKHVYIAMDISDLKQLRRNIDRAIQKESTLAELLKGVGLPFLETDQ